MKKIYILSVAILFIALVLIEVLYLTQANTLASESLRAEELKKEIEELEEKNMILESKVLSHASLQTVASRAAEIGFTEVKEVITLGNKENIALKHE